MPTLNIGGLAFGVSSSPIAMEADTDPAYRAFFADESGEAQRCDVAVTVAVGEPQVAPELEPRFDSGRSWTLGFDRARNLYQLHLIHARGVRRPICIAEFDDTLDAVHITCAPEMLRKGEDGIARIPNLLRYPLDQLLLMMKLATRGGLIVHASGIVKDGRALVLCGRSGAGKTTLSQLVTQAPGLSLLSDDRIVLRVEADGLFAYGTPWPGEGGHAQALRAPLCGLGFLRKDAETRSLPLAKARAAQQIFPVASVPWFDGNRVEGAMQTVEQIVAATPTFEFCFSKTNEVINALDGLFSTGAATDSEPPRGAAPSARHGDGPEHGAVS